MLSFFKKWFGNKGKQGKHTGSTDPVLDLGPAATLDDSSKKIPKADIHRLMIQATRIRKTKGYHEAVLFLEDLAEYYLKERNTALVTTVNKLVPYMKKDTQLTYEKARQWLQDLIGRLPVTDPYFLNVHITMAELLEVEGTDKAIEYLKKFLQEHLPSADTYYHLIRLADFYRKQGDLKQTKNYLEQARQWWDTKLARYRLIKMLRRWHHSAALLSFEGNGSKDPADFLFHRFMEFALDMACVLDPVQIDEFHKRKDQYYKGKRGFSGTSQFEKAIESPALPKNRDTLIRDIFGFVFEEMPLMLGVPEKQLHFHPGDPESLDEVRQKKLFSTRPFTRYEELEKKIRKIVGL
ncbi:MAG TPA: hypothetical protein ENK25_04160 [Bacteroidetes bacterium]|nr:hypothetical protein [Bacteroidota bacterium]